MAPAHAHGPRRTAARPGARRAALGLPRDGGREPREPAARAQRRTGPRADPGLTAFSFGVSCWGICGARPGSTYWEQFPRGFPRGTTDGGTASAWSTAPLAPPLEASSDA